MKKIDVLILIILFFLSCAMLRSFFRPGIFTAHDIENHAARIANFASALKAGQFPVRWAGNLNHKFGYPVFNYNYPLPNILALPFMLVGFNVQTTLKFILFLAYWLSGVFFYLWMKKYVSRFSAFFAAVFYLTFPYQLIDIFIRGVVGENLTLALFPAILYLIDKLTYQKNRWNYFTLVITIFLFFLSHNVYVLLFTPIIIVYLLCRSKIFQKIKPAWMALGNGFLLGSFFWLPAWFEKKYINLSAFDPTSFYRDHFVSFSELINDRWRFGYSGDTTNPMTITVGWPLVFILLISIMAMLVMIFKKEIINHKPLIINQLELTVGTIFLIFMITPASQFLWKIIPLVGYLQFPWRLLGLVGFAGACLVGMISINWGKGLKFLFILGLLVYAWRFTFPFGWEKKDDNYFFEFPFTTTTRHENTPIWFSEDNIISINTEDKIIGEKNNPIYHILSWIPHVHRYEIENNQEQTVWERTAYFPGWKLWINDQLSTINYTNQKYPGLIGYDLKIGKHQVVTQFTEDTPARIIGDTTSIVGLVVLGLMMFKIKWIKLPDNEKK